jgi:hypothetical protein
MDSKLSPAQADPHHDGDVALVTPKDGTDAEEALSKPAHVAANRRPPTAGADFSAGPRMTGPSLDAALRRADVNNEPSLIDQASPSRRTSRSIARFVVAACVGVAATLACQSYGGTTMQIIANSAPPLSWLLSSPPAMNPPSGREIAVEQSSPPAVQASAPQATSAQAGAVASTASETATSTAPTAPSRELQQRLETMEQNLAAVRQSVEQLAAGQEQMARDIAKLHTAGQDIRRRTSALPPAAATPAHKPVPPPQPALPSSAAPLTPPPPEPAPQSSAAPPLPGPPEPPRPPMPVR